MRNRCKHGNEFGRNRVFDQKKEKKTNPIFGPKNYWENRKMQTVLKCAYERKSEIRYGKTVTSPKRFLYMTYEK